MCTFLCMLIVSHFSLEKLCSRPKKSMEQQFQVNHSMCSTCPFVSVVSECIWVDLSWPRNTAALVRLWYGFNLRYSNVKMGTHERTTHTQTGKHMVFMYVVRCMLYVVCCTMQYNTIHMVYVVPMYQYCNNILYQYVVSNVVLNVFPDASWDLHHGLLADLVD